MKNLRKVFGIMLFATMALMTSCLMFDTGTAPTITWKQNVDTVKQGVATVVTFEITIAPDLVAGSSITNFCIDYDTITYVDKLYTDSVKTQYYTFKYTVPADAEEGSIDLIFSSTDNNSLTTVETASIIVTKDGGGGVDPITAVLLTKNGTLGYNSTSLTNNTMMLICDADGTIANATSADADLAFAWQDGYGYSVCSPNAAWIKTLFNYNSVTYNNTSKHSTKIMKYSGDYANLTETIVDNLVISSGTLTGGGNGVQNLSSGDMVAFETQSGQKGVLKIISNAKITKSLNYEVKYQKPNSSTK